MTAGKGVEQADVLVLGAGIAGLSVAAELAVGAKVVVLEAEAQPAYHSTGRSAAVLIEAYENDTVWALTKATRSWLQAPPDNFAEHPVLSPRGTLDVAAPGQEHLLAEMLSRWQDKVPGMQMIDADEAVQRVPMLRREQIACALLEPGVQAMDVHAMVQGHLRLLRARGGVMHTGCRVDRIRTLAGQLEVAAGEHRVRAPVVVNAAGAWAAQLAVMAGSRVPGPVPHRRTAMLVPVPDGMDASGWPLVHGAAGGFYFKPEAGQLMLSAADATPSPPCDAAPEELDVAMAVAAAQEFARLPVQGISHRWAGLRSFVPDMHPVLGFDPDVPGLFWLAGQGGFGVQTSSGLAQLAAAQVLGLAAPPWVAAYGLAAELLAPERLLTSGEVSSSA